jgi:hypothetical protein
LPSVTVCSNVLSVSSTMLSLAGTAPDADATSNNNRRQTRPTQLVKHPALAMPGADMRQNTFKLVTRPLLQRPQGKVRCHTDTVYSANEESSPESTE